MSILKMNKSKQEMFDYLGITKFWKAGYTGKGIKIMSGERIVKNYHEEEEWQKINALNGYNANSDDHGSEVMEILLDICPDAAYYTYPISGTFTNTSYNSKAIDYIINNKINLFTTSSGGSKMSKGEEQALQDCIDIGCTFFIAGGNKYGKGILSEAKSDKYLAIGAVVQENGKWKRANFGSAGEELDYVAPWIYKMGESFTTPIICAMCGLVQDFFLHNAGRTLYRDELIKFMNDNVVDVYDDGFDIETGNGLFVLPSPNDIDVSKYMWHDFEGIDYTGFPQLERGEIEMKGIEYLHPELEQIIKEMNITQEQLVEALKDVVSHKINKDKRPDWFTDELYETIKAKGISDMTRPNDYATRAEVATMIYNSSKSGY